MRARIALIGSVVACFLASSPPAAAASVKVTSGSQEFKVKDTKKGKSKAYYRLDPGGELKISAEGPCLLNLKVRAILPADADPVLTSLRDGKFKAELSVDRKSSKRYAIAGWSDKISQTTSAQLEVPAGAHEYVIALAVGTPVLVRAFKASKKKAKEILAETETAPLPPPAVATESEPARAAPEPAPRPDPVTPKPEAKAKAEPASAASSPGGLKPLRVVVYDLKATGLDERTANLVSESLLAEIRKLKKVSAMGMAEILALLSVEEQKQLLGCDDGSCLVEVAGALGSDNLIVGSLGDLGGKTVLSLKRLNMKTTALINSTNKTMEGGETGESLLAAVGPSIETLFPNYPLREGMVRGVAPELAKKLNPPPLPTWVFWVTASAAVAASLTSGGLKVWNHQEVAAYNHKARESVAGAAVPAEDLADIQDRADSSRVAYISVAAVAGALALASGLEALFTDWWGYGDSGPSVTPVAGRGTAGGVMTFSLP